MMTNILSFAGRLLKYGYTPAYTLKNAWHDYFTHI